MAGWLITAMFFPADNKIYPVGEQLIIRIFKPLPCNMCMVWQILQILLLKEVLRLIEVGL